MLVGLIVDVFLLVQLMKHPPDWKFLTERIKTNPWSWDDGLLIFMFYTGLSLIISLAVRYMPDTTITTPLFMLLQIILLPATGLFIITFLMFRKKSTLSHSFGITRGSFIQNVIRGLLCYIATMPPLLICSLFYIKTLEHFNWDMTYQPVIEWITDTAYPPWIHIALIITAVSFAPIVEEMLFRGIALPIVMKNARLSLSVLLVSLLFAAVHNHIPTLVPIFILAIGLSAAYFFTGSLVASITMHATFNTVSITTVFLMKDML